MPEDQGKLTEKDQVWMKKTLRLARKAETMGEVPVGALITHPHMGLIGVGWNLRETLQQPSAHAEGIAIARAAKKLRSWRLIGCTLYVSLEPCVMCAGLIVQSRLERVVIGALDPKGGAIQSLYQILADSRLNHRVREVLVLNLPEASNLLARFFARLRASRDQ